MSSWLQHDVTVQGTRLRVTEEGHGKAVVFLHGLFEDSRTWDRVMPSVASLRRAVAVDLPGFGESEKPAPSRFDYSIRSLSEILCGLYGGLELGRAVVVGHGLGGAIALRLAANHPELVAGLVLLSPLSYPSPPPLFRWMGKVPMLDSLLFKQVLGKSAFRALHRDLLVGNHFQADIERVDGYYQHFKSPAARSSALAAVRDTFDTRPIVADVRRITAPSLVIWGHRDRVYPVEFAHRLARELGGAGLRLLDTGHSPQEELPEVLTDLVLQFIAQHDSDYPPASKRK